MCSLEPVIKGQKSKGMDLLPGWNAGGVGTAEAAAELWTTQKKQHVGSVMGPPITSRELGFFSLFRLFYNPAFSGREALLGKGMKN